jgi:2-oxoisovalerate dehydrogenase E1 component beta subunit
MLASMRKTSRALVVHEDKLTGGVSAEIAAIITREAFEDRDAPVSRFAALDIPLFLYSPPLEEYSYPGRGKLEAEVQRLLAY